MQLGLGANSRFLAMPATWKHGIIINRCMASPLVSLLPVFLAFFESEHRLSCYAFNWYCV